MILIIPIKYVCLHTLILLINGHLHHYFFIFHSCKFHFYFYFYFYFFLIFIFIFTSVVTFIFISLILLFFLLHFRSIRSRNGLHTKFRRTFPSISPIPWYRTSTSIAISLFLWVQWGTPRLPCWSCTFRWRTYY